MGAHQASPELPRPRGLGDLDHQQVAPFAQRERDLVLPHHRRLAGLHRPDGRETVGDRITDLELVTGLRRDVHQPPEGLDEAHTCTPRSLK